MSNDLDSLYTKGTLVVGNYNDAGTSLDESVVLGNNDKLHALLRQNATSMGGKLRVKGEAPEVAPKKKGKKKKVETKAVITKVIPVVDDGEAINYPELAEQEDLTVNTYTEPVITKCITVTFKHPIGEIKLDVESVMMDNLGIGLVFSNEKELRFKPNQGDEFKLLYGSEEYLVMFTGVVLTWLDGIRKIMVLVNVEGKGELASEEY